MLSASATEARELLLFVENRIAVDDNVFLTSTAQESTVTDGYWEIVPRAILRENKKELNYDFRYQPSYQKFFSESNIDGADHNAQARLDWSATPRDALGLSGSLFSNRRLRLVSTDGGSTTTSLPLEPSDGQRLRRIQGSAYYRHHFTRNLSGRLDYAYDDISLSRRDFSDTAANTGSGGLDYTVDGRTAVGVSFTARLRRSRVNQLRFDGGVFQEVRTASRTFDIAFRLQRQITPSLALTAQVGPSLIDTEQEAQVAAPGFTTSRSYSNDTSVFAAVSAVKEFREGSTLSVSYSRYESGGGGQISSAIVDSVVLDLRYQLDRSWDLRLDAIWNERKEIANVAFVSDQTISRWGVALTIGRRLDGNLKVLGRFRYRTQRSQVESREDPEIDVMSAWVALQYNFETIVF